MHYPSHRTDEEKTWPQPRSSQASPCPRTRTSNRRKT